MSSITLHNLEDSLYALLKQKARNEGKSLNRTIQEMLTESVGPQRKAGKSRKKDVYAELCGAVSPEELKKMKEAEKEFEVIDEKDWK
jgi:hypothetical protein